MSQYIKIRSGQEYRLSDNGLYIETRYIPSKKEWTVAYPIPDSKKVLDFRETKTGARVEVLLSDDRWYEDNGHGFLTLTSEERYKDRNVSPKESEKSIRADKSLKPKMHKSRLGIGDLLHDARSAADDFRNVDNSSNFESDANRIANDFISGQMNMMADSLRRSEEDRRRLDKKYASRDKEMHALRKLELRYMARDAKKSFFAVMESILGHDAFDYISAKHLIKFLKVTPPDTQRVMSQALEACKQSLHEVGQTPKAIMYWSEIFYLINEGILFRNFDFIVKLMSKEFGGTNTAGLEDDDNIDGFLEYIYPKVPHEVYWGQNFEKGPDEDRNMERLEYLQTALFFDDETDDELDYEQTCVEKDEEDDEEDEDEDDEDDDDDDDDDADEDDDDDEDADDEEGNGDQSERTFEKKVKSKESKSVMTLVLKFFLLPYVIVAKFYKFMFKDILKF